MRLCYVMVAVFGLMPAGQAHADAVAALAPLPVLASGVASPPIVFRPMGAGPMGTNGAERRAHCADWGAQRPYVPFRLESRRCRSKSEGPDG